MGTRIKNFDSTGVAPGGRLFAGDLNSIQDQYADQSNLGQTIGLGTLQIGETALQLIRFGSGEARLSGAFRTDGIMRGLGGIYAGAFTTAQRDAITSANRPYGLVILNTTTNRLEINLGSNTTPSWQSLGGASTSFGALAARPSAGTSNAGTFYLASDQNGGTLYYSDGSAWTKIAPGLTEQMVPLDGSVTSAKIADGTIVGADLAVGVGGKDFGTSFPTANLFNGYRFTLFSGQNAWDCIYRADVDGTYPWIVIGGSDMVSAGGNTQTAGITTPRAGVYRVRATISGAANSGTLSITNLARIAQADRNTSVSISYVNASLEDVITATAGVNIVASYDGGNLSMSLVMRPQRMA